MGNNVKLNNLQKRNNSLRCLLMHSQLKYGAYCFRHFNKLEQVITEYRKNHSFFKVSNVVNISQIDMIKWYVRGQMGDPEFRDFYLAIKGIDEKIGVADIPENAVDVGAGDDSVEISIGGITDEIVSDNPAVEEGDYIISQYGDGWSYKTFIDGEKIFIISNELKTLKEKVRAKHLPLN